MVIASPLAALLKIKNSIFPQNLALHVRMVTLGCLKEVVMASKQTAITIYYNYIIRKY